MSAFIQRKSTVLRVGDWRRPSMAPYRGRGKCKWRGCVTLSDILGQEELFMRWRRWGRMAWVCIEPEEFVKEKFEVPEDTFVWLALRCEVKRGQKMDLKR